MRRTIFNDDHEQFRAMVRSFIEREIVPNYHEWERVGQVPRELYKRLGEIGVIGLSIPVEYGGGGSDDYAFNVVVQEEMSRAAVVPGTLRTHTDIVMPYFLEYCNEDQRQRWFPGLASGDLYSAIALTEPDTGSDLAGIRTSAVRDGDEYVVNGAKTFITGGLHADLVITLVRTSTDDSDRRSGMSLLVIEKGMPGFQVARKIEKMGLRVQDTVELSFSDVRVPVSNRLGEEDVAFGMLGQNLARERLAIAAGSVASCQAALAFTVDYVRERKVFGHPLSSKQNTKFELASVATLIEAAQLMIDAAVTELNAGRLTPVDAAKVKLFCTEAQGEVMDRCLQLYGGYGYTFEFPIAGLYADARSRGYTEARAKS